MDIDNKDKFLELMEDNKRVALTPDAVVSGTPVENYDEDYNWTRKHLKDIADIGRKALESFAEIADETKDPSSYRVVGELLNANRDLVISIIENAKIKADIDKVSGGAKVDSTGKIVNNNTTVFVGTTKDIIKKVMEEENKRLAIEGISKVVEDGNT